MGIQRHDEYKGDGTLPRGPTHFSTGVEQEQYNPANFLFEDLHTFHCTDRPGARLIDQMRVSAIARPVVKGWPLGQPVV